MPNPMALFMSLYNKWFLTNHNFRKQVAYNGIKNHDNGMGPRQQSLWVPFYPYTMFQNPIP